MGIIVLDEDFCIEGVDSQVARLFGYSENEFFGQLLSVFIPDFNTEKYSDSKLDNVQSAKGIALQAKAKDGHVFGIEYDVYKVLQQTKTSYVVELAELSTASSNIREQSSINQSQGHEWLAYLLRESPVVIYSCVPSGKFPTTFISENISKLTGYSPDQYLADPSFWINHLHPDDKDELLVEMAGLFDTDKSQSFEYRFLCDDGNYIWVLDKLKIARNSQGTPTEMLGLWLDISDRKMMKKHSSLQIDH